MSSTGKIIRWGILGTGRIAKQFALDLKSFADAELLAIGSRNLTTAEQFAREINIKKAYGSYEDLVNDQDIDVVYIATPNTTHKDNCFLCLQASKAVLCEKPFTLNAQQAREVFELANQKQLFCMEGMWMRFMPLIQKARTLIESGIIGDVCLLTADFGYPAAFNPNDRLFNLELGGGALLDRGVYPLSLAFFLLGSPTEVVSQLSIGKTLVDEQSSMILGYPQGQQAILSSTLRTYGSNEAVVIGTKGLLRLHAPFYKPNKLSVTQFSQSSSADSKLITYALKVQKVLREKLNIPSQQFRDFPKGYGFSYEIAEVMACLRKGEKESKIMPQNETLKIMEIMDNIRRQWNFKYPME